MLSAAPTATSSSTRTTRKRWPGCPSSTASRSGWSRPDRLHREPSYLLVVQLGSRLEAHPFAPIGGERRRTNSRESYMSEVDALRSSSGILVAGRWDIDPRRSWIETEDPSTEETIGRVPEATEADVDRAVAAAVELHKSGVWRGTPVSERAALLNAIADAVERRAAEFQQIYIKDQGGLTRFAHFPAKAASLALRDTAQL